MKLEDIQNQQIRAEGFAEGFKAGHAAAMQYIAGELLKQEKDKQPGDKPNAQPN